MHEKETSIKYHTNTISYCSLFKSYFTKHILVFRMHWYCYISAHMAQHNGMITLWKYFSYCCSMMDIFSSRLGSVEMDYIYYTCIYIYINIYIYIYIYMGASHTSHSLTTIGFMPIASRKSSGYIWNPLRKCKTI